MSRGRSMAGRGRPKKASGPNGGTDPILLDADGCELTVGRTSYVPWRWGLGTAASRKSCKLSKGVRMTDPESGKDLPRYHEIAFEEETQGVESSKSGDRHSPF